MPLRQMISMTKKFLFLLFYSTMGFTVLTGIFLTRPATYILDKLEHIIEFIVVSLYLWLQITNYITIYIDRIMHNNNT